VLTGAVTVSLNCWTLRFADLQAATFAPQRGQAVTLVGVAISSRRISRAGRSSPRRST
jgi:hypothetical protein